MEINNDLLKIVEVYRNKTTKWMPKNISSKIRNVTSKLDKIVSLRQRLWHIENNTLEIPICEYCQKNSVRWTYNKFQKFCSIKCSANSKHTKEKRKNTNIKKFGVEFPLQSNELVEKTRNTWKGKSKNEIELHIRKIKAGKSKKYGDENYNNKKKAKSTMLKKYGGIGTASGQIKNKYKQTNLERYGVSHNWARQDVRKNIRNTHFKKYGVKCVFQSKKSLKIKKDNYHKRFLKISKEIHNNRYRYFELKQSHDIIDIECPKHGIFQLPMYYHVNGVGCYKCFPKNIGYSQMAIDWLEYISKTENIYIQHAMNEGEHRVANTRFHVDGYCKETNTCYEFLGDVWHGNLELYEEDQIIHPYEDISVKECYDQTMSRLEEIKSLGYNIKYIWENGWNNLQFINKII